MAIGDSYNVILPFTTSNAIVPSTIVTGQLTVTGDLNATRYVALANGSIVTPAFSFTGGGTNTGMFFTGSSLAFAVAGTTAGSFTFRSFRGQPTTPAFVLGPGVPGTNYAFLSVQAGSPVGGVIFLSSDLTTTVPIQCGTIYVTLVTTTQSGLFNASGDRGFSFGPDASPAIFTPSTVGTYPATWDVNQGGQYFCRPGLAQFATTNIVPSALRSDAHLTNIASGVTTVFFTLPTTVAGLQYRISNAQSVANTVVIAPQAAADTINVFGLAKAAGASVAANAPFSSITLHCITSTQWLATEIMGTWS